MDPKHIHTQDLIELVLTTRRQLRRNALLCALAGGVAGTIGWLLLAAGFDALFPMGVPMRVAAFAVLAGILLGLLVCGAAWSALRPMRIQRIARRIEDTVPDMHNRLVTVVDLSLPDNGHPAQHSGFVERLVQQTRQLLSSYRVQDVASTIWLRRLAIAAAIALIAAVAVLPSQRMTAAMARVLRPTAPIPPVSHVKLSTVVLTPESNTADQADTPSKLLPDLRPDWLGRTRGDAHVFEGEPVDIVALVKANTDLERLTLRLHEPDGRVSNYQMLPIDSGRFSYPIASVTTSFQYQVLGGGTWTIPNRIEKLDRPALMRLSMRVVLPAYLKIRKPRIVDDGADQVSAPMGATIELSAQVRGSVQRGEIQLFEPRHVTRDHTAEDEAVWFDDAPPQDAALEGDWHWTDRHAHSGARSHTFGPAPAPYGFATRLNKLLIEADESFFIYVRPEADRAPLSLKITVALSDANQAALVWGGTTAHEVPFIDRGPLPEAGRWTRLEVPLKDLMGEAPQNPVKVSGLRFQIDGGAMLFDRAGSLRRTKRAVETFQMAPTAALPLAIDPSTDQWTGRLHVTGDVFYAVRFYNRFDYPSSRMKPIRLLATADQAPTILIERPDPSITIAQPVPVPIMARVFDDYGVKSVSLRVGPSAEELGDERVLHTYDQPQRSRTILGALDTAAHGLVPGQSLSYCLQVRDFKDQITRSDTARVTLAGADKADGENLVASPAQLSGLLKGISGLIEIQGDLAAGAGELLGAILPTDVRIIKGPKTIHIVGADGAPLNAEQLKRLMKDQHDGRTDAQREKLRQMEEQLAQQSRLLMNLSTDLEKAAKDSEGSQLALPDEVWVLQGLSQRARRLSQMAARWRTSEDDWGTLAELPSTMALSQRSFNEMEGYFQRLLDARTALGPDARSAQADMERMLLEMQARGAAQIMEELGDVLGAQETDLQELTERLADLRSKAGRTPGQQMNDVSDTQEAFDKEALERFQQIRRLLRDRPLDDDTSAMIAPWSPPGGRHEVMPVEQDTPEEDPQEPTEESANSESNEDEEPLDWWDTPVDMGPMNSRGFTNERYAGRNRPVAEGERRDEPQGPQTRRDMLRRHQQMMNQQLTANSNDLRNTMAGVDRARQKLEQMLGQLNAVSPKDGASDSARQAMEQMLASQGMNGMMNMAERSAQMRQAMQQALEGDQPQKPRFYGGYWAWSGSTRPGYAFGVAFDRVELTAEQRAAFYRLPPKMRDPLIKGMNQRAPEGYQPLIDAYYRQLGEQSP